MSWDPKDPVVDDKSLLEVRTEGPVSPVVPGSAMGPDHPFELWRSDRVYRILDSRTVLSGHYRDRVVSSPVTYDQELGTTALDKNRSGEEQRKRLLVRTQVDG